LEPAAEPPTSPALTLAEALACIPGLEQEQQAQLLAFAGQFADWNSRVNLVSRADIQHLVERHILHSLLISRAVQFAPGTRVIDVGTGGGFPGIPLAITFPTTEFLLVDSTAKKVKAVQSMLEAVGVNNAATRWTRAEELHRELKGEFDFATGRAVSTLPEFWALVRPLLHCRPKNTLPNGLLYLKGGDLRSELKDLPNNARSQVWPLHPWAAYPFFETKQLVHVTDCPPLPKAAPQV
jgi:16S rRNA (guanine527-N7)-methyltransferase